MVWTLHGEDHSLADALSRGAQARRDVVVEEGRVLALELVAGLLVPPRLLIVLVQQVESVSHIQGVLRGGS